MVRHGSCRGSTVVVHVVVQCRGSNVMVQCHGLNQFVVVHGGSIVVVQSWWFNRGGSIMVVCGGFMVVRSGS